MNNIEGLKPFILALAAALVLKLFVFDFIIADGHSMEPVIYDGQVLVIGRLSYGLRRPKAGEVVIFYTPNGDVAVKRISEVTNCAEDGFKFFAVGDNEVSSYDSRAYGFVDINSIIGKVLGY